MKNHYTAVVVGAGSIGATKPDDLDSPKSENILTHAHAYYHHPQFELIGIIDTEKEKRTLAAKKWNTNGFSNISQLKQTPDFISICIPTEAHFYFFNELFSLNIQPKMIIAEKPFCSSLIFSSQIIKKLKDRNIPVSVNYTRRFVKEYSNIKKKLSEEKIFSCVCYYDRGLLRDGSHAIDMFNYFFGKIQNGFLINSRSVDDFSKNDLTYTVHLNYEKCKNVFMIPGDGRSFSIFEMDILTDKSRYRFVDHGGKLKIYNHEKEKIYGSYMSANSDAKNIKTDLTNSLIANLNNCINYLEKKEDLYCTPFDAYEVHKIILMIKTNQKYG